MQRAIQIHAGNRLESLAGRLAEAIRAAPGDPLEPERIVVPHPTLGRWLTLELAQRLGIAGHLKVELPAQFAWSMMREAVPTLPPERPFAPQRLRWRLFEALGGVTQSAPAGNAERSIAALRGYLADGDPRKRFELADRLARAYDRCLLYRPDWIRAWERGAAPHWQARLWQRLARGETAPRHWVAAIDAFGRALADGAPASWPRRVSFFGVDALSPSYLEVLRRAADGIDIHLFMLSPCREYWGDIAPRRVNRRRAAPQDPAQDYRVEGNELLAAWGKLARDMQALLAEHELASGAPDERYDEPEGRTALAEVQRDVLDLRLAKDAAEQSPLECPDASLQVHVCHSAVREAEAMHDRLLAIFDAEPDVQPADVLMLTPRLDEYAPAIESVFAAEGIIPFNLARRRASGVQAFLDLLALPTSRYEAEAVLAPLESAAVQAKLGIDADRLADVRNWVRDAGIRWGVDAEHRRDESLPATEAHAWRFGLRRLLLGYAMAGDDALFAGVVPCPIGFAGQPGSSADYETLGRFCEYCEAAFALRDWRNAALPAWAWARKLREEALAEFFPNPQEASADAAQETTEVERLIDDFLAEWEPSAGEREGLAPRMKEPSAGEREGTAPRMKEPSAGEREGTAPRNQESPTEDRAGEPPATNAPAVGACEASAGREQGASPAKAIASATPDRINAPLHPRDAGGHARFEPSASDVGEQALIPFGVLRDALNEAAAGARRSPPRLADGVTVAPLALGQVFPAKVVCALGMNDRAFPRSPSASSLDPMAADEVRRGDRNVRDEDRLAFLEALLAARRCFLVSYAGRGLRDDAPIPPSVVLDEFKEYLGRRFPGRCFEYLHPLQPFSQKYFAATAANAPPQLFSYSRSMLAAARARAASDGAAPAERFSQQLPEAKTGATPSLDALIAFFQAPAKAFLRDRLRIRLETDDVALSDAEPFQLDGLENWQLRNRIWQLRAADVAPPQQAALLAGAGALPQGALGDIACEDAQTEVEALRQALGEHAPALNAPPADLEARIDGRILAGAVAGIDDESACLLHWRIGSLQGKHRIEAWLKLLTWTACANDDQAQRWACCVALEKGASKKLWLRAPAPAEARQQLRAWLDAWQCGQSQLLPFLPDISTTFAAALAKADADDVALARAAALRQAAAAWSRRYHDDYDLLAHGEGFAFNENFAALAETLLLPLARAESSTAPASSSGKASA